MFKNYVFYVADSSYLMKHNKTVYILQKTYTDYCKHLKNILFILDKKYF